LAEHLDHSVIELEIRHGVLNNLDMAEQAYFYFRNPSFMTFLPEMQQGDFFEKPMVDDIEKHGLEEA
jgi:hypothetical protein